MGPIFEIDLNSLLLASSFLRFWQLDSHFIDDDFDLGTLDAYSIQKMEDGNNKISISQAIGKTQNCYMD